MGKKTWRVNLEGVDTKHPNTEKKVSYDKISADTLLEAVYSAMADSGITPTELRRVSASPEFAGTG